MHIKIFEFNPVSENTYLLYDETKEAAIIDCGASNDREYKELKDELKFHQLNLKYLLNTHIHFDHILGNHFIYENYGLKPQYNKREELMPDLNVQSSAFRLGLNYQSVSADHFINDSDIISFGNIRLKALFTPGHSPGSLSFYCEEENCIFTGDVLFRRSIGRTDLWGGNEDLLLKVIKIRLFSLPEHTLVYPGHGPATTIEEEKKYNPYL